MRCCNCGEPVVWRFVDKRWVHTSNVSALCIRLPPNTEGRNARRWPHAEPEYEQIQVV